MTIPCKKDDGCDLACEGCMDGDWYCYACDRLEHSPRQIEAQQCGACLGDVVYMDELPQPDPVEAHYRDDPHGDVRLGKRDFI